jgi:hypothetical protein
LQGVSAIIWAAALLEEHEMAFGATCATGFSCRLSIITKSQTSEQDLIVLKPKVLENFLFLESTVSVRHLVLAEAGEVTRAIWVCTFLIRKSRVLHLLSPFNLQLFLSQIFLLNFSCLPCHA